MIRLLHDPLAQVVDLSRPTDKNIETDELLDTAVFTSIFTRRLAEADDELPDRSTSRQGWWGDLYEKVPSHRMGSRLWLLRRSKTTNATRNLARVYIEEALQWLIDDGIAQSPIIVTVERHANGVLAFKVEITKPDKVASRWVGTWNAHLAEL